MPPLRCLSYNCRGWNSGSLTLQNLVSSCDVCFIQEHWLHTDQLHKLNDFNSDFLSVAVSGMDSGSLLCGRPYGGCSVLYHKSLSSCIIPLASSSNRFCGIKVIDSNGSSILMISLYMPSECRHSYFTEYLNTLGELEGLIETEKCDVNMLIFDFNVDFCRDGCLSIDRSWILCLSLIYVHVIYPSVIQFITHMKGMMA